MAFITEADFPASIRTDILNALTQGEETVFTDNVDRAIDEVKSYLNGRYDNLNIFNKTGNDRNKFVVRLCLQLAVYYLYLVGNPRKLSQPIVDNYNKTLEDLEKIQKGIINPDGLPVPTTTEETTSNSNGQSFQWGSDNALNMNW